MAIRIIYDEDCQEFGKNAGFLLSYFGYWISACKGANKNHFKGRYWYYRPARKIAKDFGHLSYQEVRTAINILVKKKVLITGNFSKKGFDSTTWYAFNDEKKYLSRFDGVALPATQGCVTSNATIEDNREEKIKKKNTKRKFQGTNNEEYEKRGKIENETF